MTIHNEPVAMLWWQKLIAQFLRQRDIWRGRYYIFVTGDSELQMTRNKLLTSHPD